MNTYEVTTAPHPNSTGNDDQITEFQEEYNYQGENSFLKIPLVGYINFDIQFPVLKMRVRGTLTDHLHCVPMSALPLVREYEFHSKHWIT